MKELGKRILTAAIGIPLAIYIFLVGDYLFAIAILIIIGFGLHEFYLMAENKGFKPFSTLSIIFSVFIGIIFFASLTQKIEQISLINSFLIPTLLMTLFLIVGLYRKGISAITDISISIGGIMYVAFPLLCLIAIREYNFILPSQIDWGYFVLTMFIAIWICDSGAYFIGKAIGKHKLFPRHSPKKSWEGAIAGFVIGTAGFVSINLWLNPTINTLDSVVLGVVITVLCQFGDLIESHFKRDAGVKDSSNFFPGHGGFLDRFDGIIFIAPIVLFLLQIIM